MSSTHSAANPMASISKHSHSGGSVSASAHIVDAENSSSADSVLTPPTTSKNSKPLDRALEPSLYLFSMQNPLRKLCIKIAESAEFRWTILVFILVRLSFLFFTFASSGLRPEYDTSAFTNRITSVQNYAHIHFRHLPCCF
jgi:hypothetical protein